MTPAIRILNDMGVTYSLHEYKNSSTANSLGEDAANSLNVPEQRVFKTLLVTLANDQLVIAVLPVSSKLNMKLMAKACQTKFAIMADARSVKSSTGYVLGAVSPLGQKKRLKTVIDQSALNFTSIYISAGKRGLEVELNAQDLCNMTDGSFAKLFS